MSTQPNALSRSRAGLNLEYPMSLGRYEKYEEAQKAVDYLSDHEFPVQNVLIVGTDLKQLERVTGRLTRARVAMGGVLSGMWLGLFVGLVFSLFDPQSTGSGSIILTVAFGALFGLMWALIGYQVTGGQRDFTSVTQWWRRSTRCSWSTATPSAPASCSPRWTRWPRRRPRCGPLGSARPPPSSRSSSLPPTPDAPCLPGLWARQARERAKLGLRRPRPLRSRPRHPPTCVAWRRTGSRSRPR